MKVDRELSRWNGKKVFTKGDEVVAGFDAPAQAVRPASRLILNATLK